MIPDIISAVNDPHLFRPYVTGSSDGDLGSWSNWSSFLRVLYGLEIPESAREVVQRCTGRDPSKFSPDGYSEALLLCGRRSGKSKTIALVGAAEAILSGREKLVSPGEIPLVAILSPTRFQSRIIHEYLKGVFRSTPLLEGEVIEEQKTSFRLKNGVEVAIVTGDPRACRGFTLIACICDEIAMFGLSEESAVKGDMELVRALRPSLATTGGRFLCVGTPYAARGYAYTTFKRGFANDVCDVLVWNAPSLTMNPTLNPKIVQRAIDEDPVAARCEYCVETGLFREDVELFITRAEVEALVIPGRQELPPRRGTVYSAFADVSGGRHDDAALAIAHREGQKIVVDVIERHKAPHIPQEVVRGMCETIRKYDCAMCVGDSYAAEWTKTAFAQNGVRYERATTSVWNERGAALNKVAKPKAQLYAELLPRLHSGEVELLDNETLIVQLSSLQRRVRSGMRDSIDHPPGAKDDVCNAVAGVCDAVQQRKGFAGALPLFQSSPANHHAESQRLYVSELMRLANGGADYSGHETLRGIIYGMSNGRRGGPNF